MTKTRKPNKAANETPVPSPTAQAFIKLLGSGAYEKNNREKFRDFCEAAYCAYAKLTAPDQERADALEARYMRIVNSYRDKDYVRSVWPQLMVMGEIALGIPEGKVRFDHWKSLYPVEQNRDFLGEIAGELNALDDDQGQFFTPYSVSLMMAQINLDGMDEYIDREGYFTLAEPAVGAGSMVIAAADVLQFELKRDPMVTMLVEAWDLNYLAYTMCYLQFCWRGITAHVVRGNTLSREVFESAWTPFVHLFFSIHGSLFDKPSKPIAEPAPESGAAPAAERTIETVIEELISLERERVPPTSESVEPFEPTPHEDSIPKLAGKPVQLTLF